jgi:serine/threonine-protein kinase
MAPEQIRGQKCEARSDLFSAGIVFFEFLAGVHPFQGPSTPRRIREGYPDALADVAVYLPESLNPIFAKALAKDMAARFQTAQEFSAALRNIAREVRGSDFEFPLHSGDSVGPGDPETASLYHYPND